MKHLGAGLLAGAMVIAGLGLVVVVINMFITMGPAALLVAGLFIGVTIVATIVDWKTEKKS